MNATELKSALAEYANGFDPSAGWIEALPSRRPVVRRRVAASVLATAAVVAGIVVSSRAGIWERLSEPQPPVIVQLTGYAAPVGHEEPKDLRDHVACMRAQGFDVPDPTWTGHGWFLALDDARAIGFGTPRWKHAAFITCALDVRRPGGPPPAIRHAIDHPRPRAPHS